MLKLQYAKYHDALRAPWAAARSRRVGSCLHPPADIAPRTPSITNCEASAASSEADRLKIRSAALAARNIAAHIEREVIDKPKGWRPLVYCWRGGQRSGAMVTVMDQVGWPVTLLEGGYQTWRRQVSAGLYDTPLPHRLTLLDGPTGSGKTALLTALSARGVERTIDQHLLDGLAGLRCG